MSHSRLVGLALLALPTSLAALQTERLNGPLPMGRTAGNVLSFQLTPDETRVLFLADPDVLGRVELLSVALAGPIHADAHPDAISDPLLDEVTSFRLGPDGEKVVYAGRRKSSHGLHATCVDGSSRSIRLTSTRASRFLVSPDGTRVAFTTLTAGAGWQIRTVPIDAGADERTVARFLGSDADFVFLQDGSRIVYQDSLQLHSAPSDASAPPIQLSTGFGALLQGFRLTPDGSRAVYPLRFGLGTQLWSVPTDGSARPVRLDELQASTRIVADFELSPDGRVVAFTADRTVSQRYELFRVPIAGGVNTRLYTPTDATDSVSGPRFTPDGSRVTFSRRPSSAGTSSILAAPADGSAAPVVLLQIDGIVTWYQLTRDGTRIVFVRTASATSNPELFSAPTDGSASPTSLDPLVSGAFTLAPSSDRAVYSRRGANDLFSVSIHGGSDPVRLNSLLPPGARVWFDHRITSAGRVLFRADQETAGVIELFDVPLDAATAPRKLSAALARTVVGDVGAFQATAAAAFFVADQERDDVSELYRVELGGRQRLTRLNPPLASDRDVRSDFALTSDGRWVLYRSDQDEDEKLELYAVAADGGSGPVQQSGLLPSFADVRSFLISPDGARVVFRADRDTDGVVELFSAEIGAAPIRLNAPIVAGGNLQDVEISADSRRVVYRGDLLTDGTAELFSAPLDSGGGQVRLHGPLPPGGRVTQFQLSPDGARVAFAGDLETDERTELFAAPVDGSGPALELTHLPATKDVRSFRFTADGARVLFRVGPGRSSLFSVRSDASQGYVALAAVENDAFEYAPAPRGRRVVFRDGLYLYSTLDDGSQVPVLLSADSRQFAITPDATRVVFTSVSLGLAVVPIDGSSAPVVLDGTRHHVTAFQFDPAGEVLLFDSLFAVPLDGSRATRQIGWPVPGGYAGPARILEGGRVVFRGDLEVNDAFELWLARYAVPGHVAPR